MMQQLTLPLPISAESLPDPTNKIGGYYGGKATLASWIVSHFPEHLHYVEPFAGFASVLLEKPRSPFEQLSDGNITTVAALAAIRDEVEPLIFLLSGCEWGREYFERCRDRVSGKTHALVDGSLVSGEMAIAYSAMAHHRGGSRSGFSQQQCDRAAKRDWSYLRNVSERLQGVGIRCLDFRVAIEDLQNSKILIYLDPPYLDGGEHYLHTMTPDDHGDLLDIATATKSKVVISGYSHPLYQERLKGWRTVTHPAQSANRKPKVEMLWMNF